MQVWILSLKDSWGHFILHVRGEVKVRRLLSCHQDRLSNQECRLNRHLRSNDRQLLAGSSMGQLSWWIETRRCHWLQLRRSDACAPPHLASLGLLDLPGGEGHVGVAHPLLVQLLLRPQQPLQHHCKLALCALSVLCSQDGCVQFTCNLRLVCKYTFSHQLLSLLWSFTC